MLLFGVVAFFHLPVAALPEVDFPTIQVSASLPGASPETMASNVATPLERQFSLIPGVTQMTSVSSNGSTSITLQFDLSRNIDAAAQDVQAAINAASAQLPTNFPSTVGRGIAAHRARAKRQRRPVGALPTDGNGRANKLSHTA